MRKRILRSSARVAATLIAVAAITMLCSRMAPVNATTAGFLYLLAVLFAAALWGLVEAIVASLAAVLCFNYFFLPPIGAFTIADPQNWVALVAFLATAITASQLSSIARRRAMEALQRGNELERLYALSRSILLIEPGNSVPKQLAAQIAQCFGVRALALYDRNSGEIIHAGPNDFPGGEEQLRDIAVQGAFVRDAENQTLITAIRLGADPIGSLAISGVELSDSALQSLVNLVAIGLERARAEEASTRAEAARQSDELKSTLLDAVAHEFKTPLTSIKAASTSLLSSSGPMDPRRQLELMTIVDEEADRLSELVTEAIQMSRIEAGRIHLERAEFSIGELASRVVAAMTPALDGRIVEVLIPAEAPLVWADAELVQIALRQLIDNALKYSPASEAVTVGVRFEDSRAIVSVADHGPGIPENERVRIFEKFHRGSGASHQIPGAGLGLAIARDIVQAHGGEIWADVRPGGGAVFQFSLPVREPRL